MKIKFYINYHTQWGQKIKLAGSLSKLGKWDDDKAAEMVLQESGNGNWELEIEVKNTKSFSFEYKYFIFDENSGVRLWEWGENRAITVKPKEQNNLEISDFWRSASDPNNINFSSAFTNALFPIDIKKSKESKVQAKEGKSKVRFQIKVSRLEKGDRVGIVGSAAALGKWKWTKMKQMDNPEHPLWTTDVVIDNADFPLSYKYCIFNELSKEVSFVEGGKDRVIAPMGKLSHKTVHIRTDENFNYPRFPWKGAGVAVPVFSLRTKNSMGVGEFLDIKLLVDWAKKTGMKMVQILPVNDTVAMHTWKDSYPYAAISVFALHPQYINLHAIGKLSSKITEEIVSEQARKLNELKEVDYEAVMRIKSRYLKLIFDEKKEEFLNSAEFKTFFLENQEWLVPYAAFSYLRDLFGTPDFSQWNRFEQATAELLEELTDPDAPHYEDIAVHYFIQYHLHVQLLEAADYARSQGIVLKGDIPIGIYRNSVDAWIEPKLYNMESQAGAPPDDFADKGQNWKFPTYNWDEMAKDDYKWWKNRLKKMSSYFDAFRIDHILGFFRIWEIPGHAVEGLMGYFNPSIPIHKNEFSERGIWFDYNRFCRPFIREHMLYPLFGEETQYIKDNFLNEYQLACFNLKPEYDTQKKVEKHFAPKVTDSADEINRKERLKNGLFYLISEVLFFEAPFTNGDAFNPRHSMYKTWSYQDLDEETRRKLNELYIDYYYRRNEEFWHNKAMVKLPAIKNATNMLVCGEDLGMVPECVPAVMNELGILSLEVQRMPKNPKVEFGHPANYPYLSVATPSSHDTSTIRGWWEEDSTRSQKFFNTILGHQGGSPFYCDPWIVRDIVNQHMYSPSMWAVFPIQDLIGMNGELRYNNAQEERINVPSNPNHYWRYRFHMFMEDLLEEDEFNESLLNMVKESGRYYAY